MINLLPPVAQRHLAWEYRLRLLALIMMAMTFAVLVLLLLSLPVWLMQKHQLLNMSSDGGLLTKLAAEQLKANRDAKTAAAIIEHFSKEGKSYRFSEVMTRIDTLAGDDITVTQFSVDEKNKATINGVAAVRISLSAFRDRLEEDDQFSGVTLPLSSLVEERDVDFTITLKIK